MSQKSFTTEKPSLLDSNCKQIIEFLAKHHFPQAISLFTLQHPDLQLFWSIANFTFKQLDSSLSVSSLKELNDILKALNSPYQTIKASADPKSWEKLVKILAWACKIISSPPSLLNPFSELCFAAYQESLKSSPYNHLVDSYFSSLPSHNSSTENNLKGIKEEIILLQKSKNSIQISLVDDKLFQMNEELYKEIQILTDLEADYKILYNYSQALWEFLRKKLGGRSFNGDLTSTLKQEQQELHVKSIAVIQDIVEIEGYIENLREKVAKRENCENREKQLLDYQENIEKTRQEHSRILTEIKNCSEKISETSMELNGILSKHRKEQKLAQDIIIEDRESISQHARVIADWLETIDLNTF